MERVVSVGDSCQLDGAEEEEEEDGEEHRGLQGDSTAYLFFRDFWIVRALIWVSYYVRKLPHWHPEATALFVTWRLFGSVPRTGREACSTGPRWLWDDRVAQVVVDALIYGQTELGLYELLAWVVMPNHVHILIQPAVPLPRITQSIKGYSAKLANEILGRTGQPFWKEESYDHWVRDRYELEKVIGYIERNPVKAGLVDWRWSSVHLAG